VGSHPRRPTHVNGGRDLVGIDRLSVDRGRAEVGGARAAVGVFSGTAQRTSLSAARGLRGSRQETQDPGDPEVGVRRRCVGERCRGRAIPARRGRGRCLRRRSGRPAAQDPEPARDCRAVLRGPSAFPLTRRSPLGCPNVHQAAICRCGYCIEAEGAAPGTSSARRSLQANAAVVIGRGRRPPGLSEGSVGIDRAELTKQPELVELRPTVNAYARLKEIDGDPIDTDAIVRRGDA
jgi:hypothetical protein